MRPGIGDTLRAARRAQGRTLSDAAEATRVRETYLAALEQEHFESLGGDVYARGFLRSYARYLQLDPEPLVRAYQAEVSDAEGRGRGRPARRRAAGHEGSRRPVAGAETAPPRGGEHASRRERPPQERPPGAAVLLALVVIVLVVVAFVGLRGGRAGATAVPWSAAGVPVEDIAP